MTQSIQDYRSFGFHARTASTAMTEGDAPFEHLTASETGLPNGIYIYHASITWIQPTDKYMKFNGTIQGDAIAPTAHMSAHATHVNASSGTGLAVVTDGTLEIHLTIEFENQAGSASGSVEAGLLTWERKTEG